MRRRRLGLIAVAALATTLMGFALIAGMGQKRAHADGPPRNGITITAEGSASLPPDLAHVSGNVRTQAAAAADALSQNDATLAAVLAALKAAGATDTDIATTGVQVNPVSAAQGGVSGYQAADQVTVKTTDLSTIGSLIQAMVGAGISDVSAVDYALQDPNQLQLLAAQGAIANARRRAQAVAASLGVQAGSVLDFSFGAATPAAPPAPPPPTVAVRFPIPAPTVAPPPVRPSAFSTTTQVTVTFSIVTQ